MNSNSIIHLQNLKTVHASIFFYIYLDVLVRTYIAVYHFVILHIYEILSIKSFFWDEIDTFIQKVRIKLIEIDSKDISQKELYFK